jgi:hypothetical protein
MPFFRVRLPPPIEAMITICIVQFGEIAHYGKKYTFLLRFLMLPYIVPTYNLIAFSLGSLLAAALVMI